MLGYPQYPLVLHSQKRSKEDSLSRADLDRHSNHVSVGYSADWIDYGHCPEKQDMQLQRQLRELRSLGTTSAILDHGLWRFENPEVASLLVPFWDQRFFPVVSSFVRWEWISPNSKGLRCKVRRQILRQTSPTFRSGSHPVTPPKTSPL